MLSGTCPLPCLKIRLSLLSFIDSSLFTKPPFLRAVVKNHQSLSGSQNKITTEHIVRKKTYISIQIPIPFISYKGFYANQYSVNLLVIGD